MAFSETGSGAGGVFYTHRRSLGLIEFVQRRLIYLLKESFKREGCVLLAPGSLWHFTSPRPRRRPEIATGPRGVSEQTFLFNDDDEDYDDDDDDNEYDDDGEDEDENKEEDDDV